MVMRRAAGRHCLFFLSLLLFTYIFEQNCAQSPPIENYELLAAEHPARRRSLAATTYYVQVQPSQYIITVRVQQILLCQQQPKQVVLHPPTQNYELLTLCGRLCSTVPAIGSAPATMYAYQTAERKVRHCDCASSSSSTYAFQLLIRTKVIAKHPTAVVCILSIYSTTSVPAADPARRRSHAATTYYVQVQPPQYIITVRVQQILLCQQET